jgi:hypothetical protein
VLHDRQVAAPSRIVLPRDELAQPSLAHQPAIAALKPME